MELCEKYNEQMREPCNPKEVETESIRAEIAHVDILNGYSAHIGDATIRDLHVTDIRAQRVDAQSVHVSGILEANAINPRAVINALTPNDILDLLRRIPKTELRELVGLDD